MNVLVVEDIQLAFGQQEILKGEGFALRQGETVGLIGPNGSGKSTLMNVLMNRQPLDSGNVHYSKGITVGYLSQDVLDMPEGRLLRTVLDAAPGLPEIERKLVAVEEELQKAGDQKQQEELSFALAELHEQREMFETQYSRTEAESILIGLGFRTGDFSRKVFEFSGGWKMRAALAGLLFRKPDLLLLDEPTNHLDVPSVQWFDDFMRQLNRAVLLISHDREFLDRQAVRILSFEFEGLRNYTGNYSQYLKLRADEEALLFARVKNVEAQKKQAERFINRFRSQAKRASAVQSKVKELARLEQIELPKQKKTLRFSFPSADRTGKEPIGVRNISKSFPGVELFRNLDLHVYRGDRIAIVGVNGAGKTTLLKMLAGELEPDSGKIEIGHKAQLSYYAQHQSEKLNTSRTVLDEVWSVVPDATMGYVRNVCGAFLFSGDEVEKHVAVLSGGEKARVSLAKILLKPGNLLLMDEPTNHLDIWSSEALGEALESYDGTLVFVSHNRSFVNRLAKKVWDLSDGSIEEFPGNLDDYLYHKKLVIKQQQETRKPDEAESRSDTKEQKGLQKPLSRDAKKEQKRKEAHKRQKAFRQLGPLKENIKMLEDEIEKLETQYENLQKALSDPKAYEDGGQSTLLLSDFDKVKQRLDARIFKWEEFNEKAERITESLEKEDS